MNDRLRVMGIHLAPRDVVEDNSDRWGPHDTAAAIVDQDGNVLAAVEEERLNRIKHANFFPVESIKYCLASQSLMLEDLDAIVIALSKPTMTTLTRLRILEEPESPHASTVQHIGQQFEHLLGCNVADKLQFSEHHEAHAWSAYGCSDFDRALVLVLDGDGEDGSGLIATAAGSRIDILKRFSFAQSLGHLYEEMTHYIGYHRFDEYKMMGLAPYGDPDVYRTVFEQGFKLLDGGNFSIVSREEWIQIFVDAGLFEHARRKGQPFAEVHKNFCASVQRVTERIVLHVLDHYRQETGLRQLCVAGGVGHNCSMNGEIYRARLFDEVFFQPVAHDAGLAIGAALDYVNRRAAKPPKKRMRHLYLGPDLPSPQQVGELLSDWQSLISVTQVNNAPERAAELLAKGAAIGWVQGRSEFGPRALGNRSIIADPRPPENKEIINAMIKKREGYRPFAPSVLDERVADFFEVTADRRSLPFMILTLKVKEEFRSKLGAITHVDGTARVQTVLRDTNPRYWTLLDHFGELTGFPIVLNTSMNNHAEPIVDSVDDAVVCYLTTGLHYIFVGDYLVERKVVPAGDLGAYEELRLSLPAHRYLAKKATRNGVRYTIGSNVHPWLSQQEREISPGLFHAIANADGKTTIGELLSFPSSVRTKFVTELQELWQDRCVVLAPARPPR